MKEDAKSLGEVFKHKRKELNLSLKEVENATSIRMSHLLSIEEGELQKVISPIYAQGFVKQYASFLGVDGDKLVKEFPHIFNKGISQEFSYGIGTLEMRGNPGAGIKWFPNAMWVVAFIAILGGAWYLAKILEVL
ncbi:MULTISPECIES: helix-turn-helix domain-containing protein [Parachlamydia]|jgi:cytoskeletal protein RodZ|uniref:HTH cro/C1-type domain-containing protein n=2 Tax=Parachlamydia acanthamoebae TaxID=83552 RepID=F8L0M2_PARAV|nr:helix-turn-helix domain-containing protein [Parachlamydia acanthamoebae]EFB41478.1 hypothetical protein pah_c032o040 [Parachlamydia acanthamoebae str. Hall's coccus]KIA77464.1 hypothetical protein DB43_GF00060 [Parachlamydia acanthamoebae]CCB86772.1 putative uncharacterized protein [Parachlamydia acanthamoebae UV-7]